MPERTGAPRRRRVHVPIGQWSGQRAAVGPVTPRLPLAVATMAAAGPRGCLPSAAGARDSADTRDCLPSAASRRRRLDSDRLPRTITNNYAHLLLVTQAGQSMGDPA